jgi:hypothetical protein
MCFWNFSFSTDTPLCLIFVYTQIDYETAAESQRKELASKLTEDFLNQENGVSKVLLSYWKYAWPFCLQMIKYINSKNNLSLHRISLLLIYSPSLFVFACILI